MGLNSRKVYKIANPHSSILGHFNHKRELLMDQQDKLEKDSTYTGIRKFWKKVQEENGNKLIILTQDRYAIFDAYEVFILCGRDVLMLTGVHEKVTQKDILRKYGVQIA